MTARRTLGLALAALLGVAAAFLVACGGSEEGLLPRNSANRMESHLDAVRNAVAARRCAKTQSGLARLQEDLSGLPATVDQRLRDRLISGIERLSDRALRECQPPKTTPTTPTVTETTTTETTPTTTTPTITTPTTTTPTTTTPTTTTPPTTTTGTGGTEIPTVTTPAPGAEEEK